MATNFSWWRLHDGYSNTRTELIADIMDWLSSSVGVDENPSPPNKFTLSQNYPNPFNAQTTVGYTLPQKCRVRLSIYNIMGQKVASPIDGIEQAGFHQIVWDAASFPSGVYFARLDAGEKSQNIKMILLK